MPPQAAPAGQAGGAASEEPAWKNSWNWNLPDASFGSLILKIHDGRVNSEMYSQGASLSTRLGTEIAGFNFAYRAQSGGKGGPPQPASTGSPAPTSQRPAPSTSRPSGPPPPQKDGPDVDNAAGPSGARGPKPPQQPRNPPSQQNRANGPPPPGKSAAPSGWDTAPAAADKPAADGTVATGWGDSNEAPPSLSALAGNDATASSNANAPPRHHDGEHANRGGERGRGRGRGGRGGPDGPRGGRGRGGGPPRGGNSHANSANASPAPPAPAPAANGA